MATVIDTLIVELGLDPKKFDKGQQEALARFKDTQDKAKRGADNIEQASKRSGEMFGTMTRQVTGFLSLLAGGYGMREFVKFVTQTGVSTGRLSRVIGESSTNIAAWRSVLEGAGGTAEGADTAFRNFSDQIQQLKATGEASFIPFLRQLEAATGAVFNLNKPVTASFIDMAEALNKLAKSDEQQAYWIGKQIIGDEALVDLMIRKGRAIGDLVGQQKSLADISKEDQEAAERLTKAWNDMSAAAVTAGRSIVTSLEPALTQLLNISKSFISNMKGGNFLNWLGKVFLGSNAAVDEAPASTPAPSSAAPSSPGGFLPGKAGLAEKEAFIRAEAKRRGIDPDIAMTVAKNEGFFTYKSTIPGEQSFGSFQLNYSSNPRKPSLGDRFTKDTGLDARDPNTEKAQIRYALDEARRVGWGQWYGWKGLPWAGIGTAGGAPTAASAMGEGRGVGGSSTTEVNIGSVIVNTQATDAQGIAKDIKPAIERNAFASQANYGQR